MHELVPLPYDYNALEPYYDEATVRLHHDKHQAAYVAGLNKAEEMLAAARESGDFALIQHWEKQLAFHGAGNLLHIMFWEKHGAQRWRRARWRTDAADQDGFRQL
jgi:Fe-Mn family superoxide dismutase